MTDKKAQLISQVENLLDQHPDLNKGASQKMLAEVQSLAKTDPVNVHEFPLRGNLNFLVRGNVEGSSQGYVSINFDKAGDIYSASSSPLTPYDGVDKSVSYDVTTGKATMQQFIKQGSVPDDSIMDILAHPNISNYRPATINHVLHFDQQGKVIEEDTSYENKNNTATITNRNYNWQQIIMDQLKKL